MNPVSQNNSTGSGIQRFIDNSKSNDVLELEGGEYVENITLNKPITLKGKSLVCVIGNSNIVNIESKGVILDNIYIESINPHDICLNIKKDTTPKFIDVFIKGSIQGIHSEEGIWDIPYNALELKLNANIKTKNIIRIFSPVDAKLYIDSDILSINKASIQKGINEIEITIKEIDPNSYVCGELIIETDIGLKRRISVYGTATLSNPTIMGIPKDIPYCMGMQLHTVNC
ncbi:MAG: hypothetical protein IPG24_27075 [Leptospiraceae bacterium]|nr:hypothetical protein [Leptospiraceae bacterium]